MIVILTIIAPVFGLIAIGYLAGRLRIFSAGAGPGISDFAFTLGIPALLCRTIATAKFADLSPLMVWASFFGAAALTWAAAAALTGLPLRRPAQDGPAIAMSAVFGNTAMLGLPLAIATFGQVAAAPVALVLSIHAPTLWLSGILHTQFVGEQGTFSSLPKLLRSLVSDLSRNPIILGILAGATWRLTGADLPVAVDKILELLAQAGVPASLVAMGLTLVTFEIKGQMPTLIAITALKLLFMPLAAWVLAVPVLHLPSLPAGVIVILAAMPTGANAYLFAVREGRAVNSASGAVALGTVLAAVTVAVIISAVGP